MVFAINKGCQNQMSALLYRPNFVVFVFMIKFGIMTKLILLVLGSFISVGLKAQTNKCHDSAYLWNVERNNLFLEMIYKVSEMDSNEISNQVYSIVNSQVGIKNVRRENNDIYFRVEGQMIDIQKYGYGIMFSWFGVLSPIDYNGRITCKDGRYRLIISGLTTRQPQQGTLSKDFIWYWDRDVFNSAGCLRGKTIYNALTVTRLFMSDEYNLNRRKVNRPGDF
jgi:hypothetical protein